MLEEFLLDFPGTLILVSHDRFLLDKLVSHLFVFQGNGLIKDFPGNYSQWKWAEEERQEKEALDKQAEAKKQTNKPIQAEEERPKATGQKLSFKERQELENLGPEIDRMEIRKKEIEEILAVGQETNHAVLSDLIGELGKISLDLDEKSMRWLELSERD